jgi:hypothetical protein
MTVQAALLLPSSDRRGSGFYSLAVELAQPAEDTAVVVLQRTTAILEAASNRGAFPAPDCTPLSSHMHLSLSRLDNERVAIFNVQAENVDLRAFELLRNMTQRLMRQGIEVRELRLSETGGVPSSLYRKPGPNERNELASYPSVAKVRFGVETAEFVDTRMRRCLVELLMPVAATHVQRMRQWLVHWFDLLESGAYAMPVGMASEVDCLRGDVEIFDELAIELTVNRFQASEAAWSALVNLLDTCWEDGSVIAKLSIE